MATTTHTPVHGHTPKKPLKYDPNPHPYAIKTTSTALLTRSNSSGHAAQGRHYYVPLSPSPSRSRSGSESGRESGRDSPVFSGNGSGRDSPSPSPSERNNGYRGHRYTRSLTSDIPTSLPKPHDSSGSPAADKEQDKSTPQRRRRPLSSHSIFPPSHSAQPPVTAPPDLPLSPKTWTPSQLSIYLSTALRSRSGEEGLVLPERVVNDISAWVREKGIGGRTFLRWEEADLEGIHLSTPWRTALLNASRTLRQNVLKGRIWVDSSSPAPSRIITSPSALSTSQSQGDLSPGESPSEYASAIDHSPSSPSVSIKDVNPIYSQNSPSSSSSSIDLDLSFASNSSLASSQGEKEGKRYKYKTVGRSQGKASAREAGKGNGRVRGLVQTWERSGSESEGGADGDFPSLIHDVPSPFKPKTNENLSSSPEDERPGPSLLHEESVPFSPTLEEEEPSMEALLSQQLDEPSSSKRKHHSWGARAWEELDKNSGNSNGAGITVKRLPPGAATETNPRRASLSVSSVESPTEEAAIAGWEDVEPLPTMKHIPIGKKKGSVRLKGSLRGRGTERSDRRVVTAIFNAEASLPESCVGAIPEAVAPKEITTSPGVEETTGGNDDTALFPTAEIENSTENFAQSNNVGPDTADGLLVTQEVTALGEESGSGITQQPIHESSVLPLPLPPLLDAEIVHLSLGEQSTLLDETTSRGKNLEAELEAELARQRADEPLIPPLPAIPTPAPVEIQVESEEQLREAEKQAALALALETELTGTRALVELFRLRLEEVEKNIEEMQQREQGLEQERLQEARSQQENLAVSGKANDTNTGSSAALIQRALSYIYPTQRKVDLSNRRRPGDPPVSALPSYVLLVSIGMCAVVLRVVLKRVSKGVKG